MSKKDNQLSRSHSGISTETNEKQALLGNLGQLEVSYGGGNDEYFYNSINSIQSDAGEILHDKGSLIFTTSNKSVIKSVKSVASQSSLIITLIEKLSGDNVSSLFMTICNILPVLQGSAIFGIPFAVAVGGISFIPAALLLCIMADICGLLLIDCLYEVSPRSKQRKRIHMDYKDVSEACWGYYGSVVVNTFNIVYVLANNIVNVVLLGECIYELIGEHVPFNRMTITVLFSVILLPALFIKKLSYLAYISMFGVLSIVIGSLTCMVMFIQHAPDWSANYHSIPIFNGEGYPLAMAILMYSLIINSILPQIEGSMKNPRKIDTALHISYGITTICKLLFGVFGALTFGMNTKQLVATNVSEYSIGSKYILSIMLCVYAISNFPLMFMVIYDQLDNIVERAISMNLALRVMWLLLSRVFSVAICVGIALVVPFFALVSGVTGAVIGTCLAFIFPICFHLQLKWGELSMARRFAEVVLLCIGILSGCLTTYSSVSALVSAVKNK